MVEVFAPVGRQPAPGLADGRRAPGWKAVSCPGSGAKSGCASRKRCCIAATEHGIFASSRRRNRKVVEATIALLLNGLTASFGVENFQFLEGVCCVSKFI